MDTLMPEQGSRKRSYKRCRICGANPRPGALIMIRTDRVDENGKRTHDGTRSRVFCANCAPAVATDLIAELERTE